jgi:transketolase
MVDELDRVRRLMALAEGDEKHEPSAHSTLDVIWVLYDRVMRYDPARPDDEDRDRFVLSKGHGPVAFYAVLAAKGFFPADELRRFLAWDGILGGHPDRNRVPGAEASTGSLGHGLAMAIGMALGLRAKGRDRRVFALLGDGECNEGSVWEAFLQASSLGLGNLTAIVIDNRSSPIDMGDIEGKARAFGWAARTVDGRSHAQIEDALRAADPERPTAVVARVSRRRDAA